MALATRCPHCKTTFRVVQDQLKLYSGMVRCGVCQQVFNGLDYLTDDEAAPPAAPAPSLSQPSEDKSPVSGSEPQEWPVEESGLSAVEPAPKADTTALDPSLTAHPASKAPEEYEGFDSASLAQADELAPYPADEDLPIISLDLDEGRLENSDIANDEIDLPLFDQPESSSPGTAEPNLGLDLHPWEDTIANHNEVGAIEPSLELPPEFPAYNQTAIDAYLAPPAQQEPSPDLQQPAKASAAPEPEFVRKAKSRQKSKRFSRILYAVGSIVLLALFALQALYTFRDTVPTQMPWAEPILAEICSAFECETPLSAKIDELSIESSELQTLPNQPGTFILEVVLRNRSSSAQNWPSIELTLNDESGQPVVRRVLPPAEYLADTPQPMNLEKGFPAQSEQNLKLVFSLEQAKAAGYRVYLFYP